MWSVQCRTVKITVSGDESVPVQVDGEAWLQQPGVVYIAHKNRAQMLTRHKVTVTVIISISIRVVRLRYLTQAWSLNHVD